MIPTITAAQMREVDRVMVEELHIELVQMMENAGRALADHARRALGGDVRARKVAVLAGAGGNGGGGSAAARRLSTWGAKVTVVLAQAPQEMKGVPAQQLAILERMGINIRSDDAPIAEAELILDALVGYSLRGAPRGRVAELVRAANARSTPIIALDLPSGLDPDTGVPSDPTIRAASTLTLALPKRGLIAPCARDLVGELYLADISVPEIVYRRLGITVGPIFAMGDIVPVDPRAMVHWRVATFAFYR
jgi:NAD(P)H-hydrate epimerase